MVDNTTSEQVPIDDPITDLRNQLREQSLFQHQTTQVLQRSIQHLAQSIESLKLSVPHHLQPPNNNQSTSATLQNTPSAALPNEPIANTSKCHLPLKIDLPKFDGADPHGWIFLMQEFFDYHDIPEEQRLSYVSFMVSGEASEWLRWMKNNNLLRSWPEFLDQVRLRFDSSHFEDFLGRLSKTCQATTVAAYRAEYEKLLNKVTNVPKVVLISMFVAGLKSTIRREVQRTKPTTLIQAFSLASEVEAQQGELRYLLQTHNHQKYLPRGPPQSQPHQNSHSNPNLPSPIIPLPSPVIHKKALPIVQISAAERQAKIARGECYTCDQKWSRSHRCPNRSLLLMCSEDDNSSDVLQQLDEIDEQVLTGDCSSLNSMAGPGTPHSLRLIGIIHNENLQVLIDGGSTHNFIQPQIAERLNIPIQAIPPFRVYIGNGDSLQCSQSCLDVPLSLQGHVFSVTLFILPIKGPDIVLGIQWLQDLGRVTHDYAGVSMEFMWQGVTIQLQGEQSPRLTQVSYSHLFALLESDDVHSCFELSPVPPEESIAISTIQWPNDTPTEILTILQQHAPVFELPRGLPPRRLFDHHIHLIPGSGPINVRPSGKELPEPILKKSTSPKSPIEEEIVEETLEEDKGQEKEEPSPPLSSKATQAQDKGKEKVDLPMYQPPLPFPGRVRKNIDTTQYGPQQVKSKGPTKNRKKASLVEIQAWTPGRTRVRPASRSPRSDARVRPASDVSAFPEPKQLNPDATRTRVLRASDGDPGANQRTKLGVLSQILPFLLHSLGRNTLQYYLQMPTNTRSKERAKKTRHDREASSSRAPQGVSDLIAPGGRGLPHLTEKQRERVEELQQKGVSGGFYFDYTMLDAYGCREEVEQMMRRPYWERLFNWREDTYEPVVHEFVATFEPVPSSHDCTPCMKFNLFGRGYQLSLIQLGERLGLYTHEETMSEEWINLPRDFESDAAVEAYWSRITDGRGGRFTGIKQSTSKITIPSLKMMKLLLNLTFGGRTKNLHKVYRFDLFHLWSLETNEPIQMAHMVLQMFHSQKNAKCPWSQDCATDWAYRESWHARKS
nr:uncharacterized protein LOC112097934 [Ipomoea trifida]